MRLGFALGVAPLVAWLGCVQLFDIERGNLVVKEVPPLPITGLQIRHFVLEQGGVVDVPVDFRENVAAYVENGDGGVREYPGTGKGDGTFTIEGVPDGAEWYVKSFWYTIDTPVYAFSTGRRIDLSEHMLGRADVKRTPDAGPSVDAAPPLDAGGDAGDAGDAGVGDGSARFLHIAVSDLAPVTPTNALELVALNVGYFNPRVARMKQGADASTLDDSDPIPAGTPIIEGEARNDVTYLTQSTPVGDAGAIALTRALTSTTFSMAKGPVATFAGQMQVLPPATPYTVKWDHSAFTQYAGSISKSATIVGQLLFLNTVPAGSTAGQTGPTPDLFGYEAPGIASGVESVSVVYSDPFPAHWQRFLIAGIQVTSGFSVMTDKGPVTGQTRAALACNYPMPAYDGKVLGPILSPVQAPFVNGGSAFDDQTNVTTRPTVTWQPPAIGKPTTYYVSIREIVLGGGRITAIRAIAKLVTTATKVTVPPGILEAGHHYTFALGAIYSEGRGAAEPLATSFPYCLSTANTGALTPWVL